MWGLVVQFLSFIGIDMIQHKINFFLRQELKRGSLGENPADKFVSNLNAAFLVRAARIAVKNAGAKLAGTHIAFNGSWIGKFAASVGQDHWK